MQHGMITGSSTWNSTRFAPINISHKSGMTLGESSTYRFVGFKPSIIEFLVAPKNRDKVFTFKKNTSKDEYGTTFPDSDLHIIMCTAMKMPTSPGAAISEMIRSAAGGIATSAITGTVSALGAGANAAVQFYEVISGVEKLVGTQVDVRSKVAALAAKKAYKNQLVRQAHHKLAKRIIVDLQGRVSPSVRRNRTVVSAASTSITCGALAVIIDARG